MSRVVFLSILLVLAGLSCAADQVVYQEDFSAPFVQVDWIYNNSASHTSQGYPGGQPSRPWPCMVGDDGFELLGYPASVYYATSFENSPFVKNTSISGVDGWNGTGTIVDEGHSLVNCARFSNQNAYRNVTDGPQQTVQYVDCWIRSSYGHGTAYIYVGTTGLAAAAAVVRLNSNGNMEAQNGNRAGGGTWVTLQSYQALTWYAVRIKLDYSAHTYSVSINKGVKASSLGFRDAASLTALNAVKFDQPDGSCLFYVDDLCTGNTPYPPGPAPGGQSGRPYWSDGYNKWCQDYGNPMTGAYDVYDWMSCTDTAGNVNTDPTKPPCYKAALPTGWTAAFGMWADWDPYSGYSASSRGKMGFCRLMGAYAQSPSNPCLHAWSSHGDMRVVSPNISSGPGVYSLSWNAGVWNCNTADPAQQFKWTDFCMWGHGYTNWCVWDNDPVTTPPYYADQVNEISVMRFWSWYKDPFHDSDPLGSPPVAHRAGEEPGQWHSYTRTFAFGSPPVPDPGQFDPSHTDRYEFAKPPGYFIGFRVSHGHDPNNQGYQWGTICNIDDIVLTKKSPVTIAQAEQMATGSLVEIDGLVITNMVPPDRYYRPYLDFYLSNANRSNAIMMRVPWSIYDKRFYNNDTQQFAYSIGDVVNVVGAISADEYRLPGIDTKSPVRYIGVWQPDNQMPALVGTGQSPVDIEPVAINNRDLVGSPVTPGRDSEGMLVTVFGRVNHLLEYAAPYWYFYVDDGTGLSAGETYPDSGEYATGVKIDLTRSIVEPGWVTPSEGEYAAITGTLTCELLEDGFTKVRVVYPRHPGDIRTVPE